jgi:class 3 adenylate cyclase
MAGQAETKYVRSGDTYIAYQVTGQGTPVVFLPMWFSNIEVQWQIPMIERVLSRATSFCQLIRLDQRGSGLSDPVNISEVLTVEERAGDITAVLDAIGCDRAVIFGVGVAAPLACFYAASHTERTSGLILHNATAKPLRSADFTIGKEDEEFTDSENLIRTWPTPEFSTPLYDPESETAIALAHYRRMSMGPGAAAALFKAISQLDVRNILSSIHVPTLITHRRDNPSFTAEHARYLADHIAGSTLVLLPGSDPVWSDDDGALLDEVQDFVTGTRPVPAGERVLATVMFTDIVSSTERLVDAGDRAWKQILSQHDDVARRTVARYRGRVVSTAGDGLMATFDGPARAIRCAGDLHAGLRALGLDIRAGLHTGEVEPMGDEVRGLAVHIAARVSAIAGANETLVSSTVKDLVAGSGISFEDRGLRELKGVPGAWHIFAVTG